MAKQIDRFLKALKMQRAFEDLVAQYREESPGTDAFNMALDAKIKIHALSNASLARLYDILEHVFIPQPMHFEDFRMTAKPIEDNDKEFRECYGLDDDDKVDGYKYVDRYFIQFIPTTGYYSLILSNQEWVNRDRAVLEKILYEKEYKPNFFNGC